MADVGWVPRGPQLELVRMGLDPSSTIEDFARWQQSIDFESMDWSFAELLPLFASRFGSDDGRINGLRRRHFYVNTIAVSRINEAIGLIEQAGITGVMGGGLAAMIAYPDLSCRSLPDAELIVATVHRERAQAILLAAGWTVGDLDRCCHESGAMLKLVSRLRGTVEGFIDEIEAVPFVMSTITGRELRVIPPAIAVAEVAINAVWPMPNPPIRWVVDLDLLVADVIATGEIDAIVNHARAHGAAQLVRVALCQARRLGARSIPGSLLRQLARVPATAFERRAVMERTSTTRFRFWVERVIGR